MQETENGALANALANKMVDALWRYLCLAEAFLERRFCFVAATFQGLDRAVAVEEFADITKMCSEPSCCFDLVISSIC